MLVIVGWLQLSYQTMTLLGYQDISHIGRVVVNVESVSVFCTMLDIY